MSTASAAVVGLGFGIGRAAPAIAGLALGDRLGSPGEISRRIVSPHRLDRVAGVVAAMAVVLLMVPHVR
jgi:hypothetical protein